MMKVTPKDVTTLNILKLGGDETHRVDTERVVDELGRCNTLLDEFTKRQSDTHYTQEQRNAVRKDIQRHLDDIPKIVRKERKNIKVKQQSGNLAKANAASKREEQINQTLAVIDGKLTQTGITDEWYEAFRRDG